MLHTPALEKPTFQWSLFLNKNEMLLNPLSVFQFIHFSTYFSHLVGFTKSTISPYIYIYIYIYECLLSVYINWVKKNKYFFDNKFPALFYNTYIMYSNMCINCIWVIVIIIDLIISNFTLFRVLIMHNYFQKIDGYIVIDIVCLCDNPRGSPHGAMAKVLDLYLKVSKFKL